MPAAQTRFAQAVLAATIGTHYTVPASNTLVDASIYLWNDDTVLRTVTLHYIPSAGSPTPDNYIIESYPIYPKTGVLVQPKQVIATGGTIRAFADVANKVSVQLSGLLVPSTDTTIVTRFAQIQLTAALATIYTASPGAIIDEAIWLYNFDTSPRSVVLQFIPSAGSSLIDYTLLNGYVLQAKTGIAIQPGQVIAAGGTIRANADIANKVVIAASGLQL